MPRASIRVLPLLFLSVALAASAACTSEATDGSETGDESDLTEGSAEARATLALVNDSAVKADELLREARVTIDVGNAIIAHRDGADAQPGTTDDDAFDTLRELDAIPGVGPATIRRLYDYAKRKGLVGGATEVIFSPAPAETSHLVRIAKEIDLAQKSLDIAIYSYSDAKIGEALARAVARGVKVRFVFNDAGDDARAPAASLLNTKSGKLEQAGVNVRFINKIMHHKFMIVDGPRDEITRAKTAHLVTGSANWSSSAARTFDENTVFFQNQEELVLRFQREFDNMWAHSRDFAGKDLAYELATTQIPDSAIPDAPNTDVLFTSYNFSVNGTTFSTTGTNTVADGLVAGINGATRSIHIASGHLRSREVAEALIARKKANPALDVRVYLDGQEYISEYTHQAQLAKVQTCLAAAGDSAAKRRSCLDNDFLFGYQVGTEGIDVRYKYYAYRWDFTYAPQMHHKFMAVDGTTLYSGSYNLSDNAEHDTFENMLVLKGAEHAALIASFEANFESIWKTGRDTDKLAAVNARIEQGGAFPIVFDPMALTHAEVTALKDKIRSACPSVDTPEFRSAAASHTVCQQQ
jgi:phosphatidylserine/phosphatidylglycerophosphate/cardiolipin synthase-like enzyme